MALLFRPGRKFDTHVQGRIELGLTHCSFASHISGSVAHLRTHQTPNLAQITIDTDIHNHHLNPTMPGENINRRPTGKEIEHHLPGHRPGIGADSLVRNSVIRGQRKDHLL